MPSVEISVSTNRRFFVRFPRCHESRGRFAEGDDILRRALFVSAKNRFLVHAVCSTTVFIPSGPPFSSKSSVSHTSYYIHVHVENSRLFPRISAPRYETGFACYDDIRFSRPRVTLYSTAHTYPFPPVGRLVVARFRRNVRTQRPSERSPPKCSNERITVGGEKGERGQRSNACFFFFFIFFRHRVRRSRRSTDYERAKWPEKPSAAKTTAS